MRPRCRAASLFAKFGLAGWAGRDWISAGEHVRATLPVGCGFVAVAYADWRACAAPTPDEIADAAVVHRFGAFLIDTHDKSGGTLLDHLSVAAIDHSNSPLPIGRCTGSARGFARSR